MGNIGMKGQASIEFILVLLLAILFITTIIQPNVAEASDSIKDVSGIAKLRVATGKIANAIEYVSVSGSGTKRSVRIVVPEGGEITCVNDAVSDIHKVSFSYTAKTPTCDGSTDCNSRTENIGTDFTCNPATIPEGIYLAVASKVGNTVSVNFEG
ncbi:MAG: hypothetical protein NUV67_03950 [archaeon]|nr:hypothetical protein [archaeon]